MPRSIVRLSATGVAGLLATCLLVTGCGTGIITLPNDPGDAQAEAAKNLDQLTGEDGATAELPATWPESVPPIEGGTLHTTSDDAENKFWTGNWTGVLDIPEKVLEDYAAKLTAAGWTAVGDPVVDPQTAQNDYTKDDLNVNIYASETQDGTSTEVTLTITGIEPAS